MRHPSFDAPPRFSANPRSPRLFWRPLSAYELEIGDDAAGVVVAVLSGELDLTNARGLEERLDGAAPDETVLVIDLNRVVFIDSAALHVLFKLAERRPNGRLALL